MAKNVYSILALLAVIHVGVAIGLGIYLFASGRLDLEKIERIAAVVRGEPLVPAVAHSRADDAQAPMASGQSSEAKIKGALEAQEIERLKTDRMRVEVQRQAILVDRRMLRLQQQVEDFEKRVAGYESRIEEERARELSESFTELVRTISGMKSKNALKSLMARPQAEAVRILLDMPARKRNQIMDTCKTTTQSRWRDEMFSAMLQLSAQQAPDGREEQAQ